MSLLSEAMEQCTMIDHVTVADGYGGTIKRWQDGAEFLAAIAYNDSTEGAVARVAGVTDLYRVTTGRGVVLQYHDVFRRESDGKIFRVKTDGDDNATPRSAALNMRVVRAEEWIIPDE